MQAVIEISTLPDQALAASAEFYRTQLRKVSEALATAETTSLAIVLPAAGPGHDDWRRTLARDLARTHAPNRVNVVGADNQQAKDETLAYLRDAPGVTGQYLATHE